MEEEEEEEEKEEKEELPGALELTAALQAPGLPALTASIMLASHAPVRSPTLSMCVCVCVCVCVCARACVCVCTHTHTHNAFDEERRTGCKMLHRGEEDGTAVTGVLYVECCD